MNWKGLSLKQKAEVSYRAIMDGNVEGIKIALMDGDFLRRRKVFPLHIAVVMENLESIEIILGQGYPINLVRKSFMEKKGDIKMKTNVSIRVALLVSKFALAYFN